MTDHWCTYCNGVNTHNCQFNPNLPRMKIYTTNTTVVSDNEALLRRALEGIELHLRHHECGCVFLDEIVLALRDRLGASATGAGQAEIEALREALAALKAENEMLREALKDAEVKQGEVK